MNLRSASPARASRSASPARASSWAAWGPALLLVGAGVLAYHETLSVPFLFDDHRWIVDNPAIRSLADLGAILGGNNRPVLQLSFAINFGLGELDPTGYHAVNLLIHVLAALTLFGVLRRSWCEPKLGGAADISSRAAANPALVVALLWLLHPLQTQAVTYTVQRGESMAALFYLLTLYCGIRGAGSAGSGQSRAWAVSGIAACALGMGTKAVMVTAPIVVLLYDRTFSSGSFREALRRRPGWYAGLFASWLVLAGVLQDVSGALGEAPPSPLAYALTQPGVLLHYLRLAFWPDPLCFDYAWPLATTAARIVPAAGVICGLVALSAWGLWRGARWGFLAAACFLVLAPTSSVLPLADLAFEHRMYLPLAPLLALVVMAAERGLAQVDPSGRVAVSLVVVFALALGAATLYRNRVYQSPIDLWSSAVEVAPQNARAHHNLGLRLLEVGKVESAEKSLRAAQKLAPNWADAMASLGYLLAQRGELARAQGWYERSVKADPKVASAHVAYAFVLSELGRLRDSVVHYRAALALEPDRGDIYPVLGFHFNRLGQTAQALRAFERAQSLGIHSADADMVRAGILLETGKGEEALQVLREGLRREPDSIALANNLAWHLATHVDLALRDPAEAVRLARRAAAQGKRRDPEVLDTLATALLAAGQIDEAKVVIDEAIEAATKQGESQDLVRSLEALRAKWAADGASRGEGSR